MMRKTYHVMLFWAVVLSVLAWPAAAGTASVGDFTLNYPEHWQRAGSAEEEADDSFILRLPGSPAPLTVYLPRRAVPLKIEEARFYRQLERKWRAQYGKSAQISTVHFAGKEWKLCIRPSLEHPAKVFHLVTVHQGRAHHLLVIGPERASTLPEPANMLLASGVWTGAASTSIATLEIAQPEETEGSKTTTVSALPQSTVAVWQRQGSTRIAPSGPRLSEAAEREVARIGDKGMLMGYGIQARQDGLDWFMDGFFLDPAKKGKAARRPFAINWRIDWRVPDRLRGGEGVSLELELAGADSAQHTLSKAGVRGSMAVLCGTEAEMADLLEAQARADPNADTQLRSLVQSCPDSDRSTVSGGLFVSAARVEAESAPIRRQLLLPGLPEAFDPLGHERVRRLVLKLSPAASESGEAAGDALLREAAAYYWYGPVEPARPVSSAMHQDAMPENSP